jgi:hypothetical protein
VSRELAQAWAITRVKAGDTPGYREACAAFLAKEEPNPTVIWNALAGASFLALAPGANHDDRELIGSFEQRLSTSPPPRPLYQHLLSNALGGLLLRAGRNHEAIARITKGLAADKELELPTDWTYLALAHARQGNLELARHWLEKLNQWQIDPSLTYWELQEIDLLRSEAESLVFDAGFPGDPFEAEQPR